MIIDWPYTHSLNNEYICSNCGSWVGYGMTHMCIQPTYTFPPTVSNETEIKELLKRIVELLEKIAEK